MPPADSGLNATPLASDPTRFVLIETSHPGNVGTNWIYAFTGALNDADITGTFTLTTTYQNNTPPSVRPFQMRLTRQ